MRAVIVTGAFPPSHQPASTTVKHVVDAAVRAGHQLLLIAPGTPPGPASYRGVPVRRPRSGEIGAVTREVQGFAPDVVHLADPRLLGVAMTSSVLRTARGIGAATVASHHSIGRGVTGDEWGEWWSTISGTGADLTLATCLSAQEALTAAGVRAALWRPGVDADVFAPSMRTEPLVERWARGDRLVVGHVGPVDRPHVSRRLLDVGSLAGVRLVVARAADGADRLRAKLPDAVVMGDMSGLELAQVLASLDVLVQPRKKDLDAHSARRALAAGVPVVGMRAGGVADVVAHDVNGLLSEVRNRHGLRRDVARLRDDRRLRDRLAARAREAVVERTWGEATAELVDTHWEGARAAHPRALLAR